MTFLVFVFRVLNIRLCSVDLIVENVKLHGYSKTASQIFKHDRGINGKWGYYDWREDKDKESGSTGSLEIETVKQEWHYEKNLRKNILLGENAVGRHSEWPFMCSFKHRTVL